MSLPAASSKVDYEAEVAVVIGTRAKEISEAEALDHVAGYTLLNDLSARDLQFRRRSGCPARSSTAAPPAAPARHPGRGRTPDAIGIAMDLNGERMQESTTGDLIFSSPSSSRGSRS